MGADVVRADAYDHARKANDADRDKDVIDHLERL